MNNSKDCIELDALCNNDEWTHNQDQRLTVMLVDNVVLPGDGNKLKSWRDLFNWKKKNKS